MSVLSGQLKNFGLSLLFFLLKFSPSCVFHAPFCGGQVDGELKDGVAKDFFAAVEADRKKASRHPLVAPRSCVQVDDGAPYSVWLQGKT